jgi:hypothetical protein
MNRWAGRREWCSGQEREYNIVCVSTQYEVWIDGEGGGNGGEDRKEKAKHYNVS